MSALWDTDWPSFVRWLADSYSAGVSSEAVCQKIASRRVKWTGNIASIAAARTIAPALRMKMPLVRIPARDGFVLEGKHLSLPLQEKRDFAALEGASPGDSVLFSASIDDLGGVFQPFKFLRDEEQMKVFFILALIKTKLEDVKQR